MEWQEKAKSKNTEKFYYFSDQLDTDTMAKDVESFLFEPSDIKKVIRIEEVVQQYEF